MAEFDQALFLYLNSQDQTSAIQDQPRKLATLYLWTFFFLDNMSQSMQSYAFLEL